MANLNHSKHYESQIQPIEYLEANLSKDEFRGLLKGNIIKYITRYRRKGGVTDLYKAQEYMLWLIELEEKGWVFDEPEIIEHEAPEITSVEDCGHAIETEYKGRKVNIYEKEPDIDWDEAMSWVKDNDGKEVPF